MFYEILDLFKFKMIEDSSKNQIAKGSDIVNGNFNVIHKLGSGNFGEVFLIAKNSYYSEEYTFFPDQLALKVEKQKSQETIEIVYEGNVMQRLMDNDNVEGFPKFYTDGVEGGNRFIMMDLLGPNLQVLLEMCGGRFSLKTTLLLIYQVFERLEHIHSKGYLYCDIKPENFLMGIEENSHVLYIIDFGLCKQYKNIETGLMQPYKENQKYHGTIRYASIGSQMGINQTRRDDLESACYMMIYILKGSLPWQGYKSSYGDTRQNWILSEKLKTSPSSLCDGLPHELETIMQYCQELEYFQEPDYNFILGEIRDLFIRSNFEFDFCYDWVNFDKKVEHKKTLTKVTISQKNTKNFED